MPFIGVYGDGNLVITEKIPLTYGNQTMINLTATDTTGLSTSLTVKIILGDMCEINPCKNRGLCKLCRLDTSVTSKTTKNCDILPLNKIKGYMCECERSYNGLNCDFNQNSKPSEL